MRSILDPMTRVRHAMPGVSLVEMLVSLVIFSVVVFPMMMLPMKAADQTEEAKNTNLVAFEINSLFGKMRQDLGHSYRFLPITDTGTPRLYSRMLFVSYWDEVSKTEKRSGYRLFNTDANANKWALQRVDVPASKNFADYLSDGAWQSVGQILDNNLFYIQAKDGSSQPTFVYCIDNQCNTNITPAQADGVVIQSTQANGSPDLKFVYRNSAIPFQPVFMRLASVEKNNYRQNAEEQLLPFATVLTQWSINQNWMSEKDVTIGANTYRVPADKFGEVQANPIPLNIYDFSYDYKSGDILAVSNSGTNVTPQEKRGFYIFKFKPGLPDYKAYNLSVANGPAYTDNFPVILHSVDTAPYLYTNTNGVQYGLNEFLSVTSDQDDNIYVLATAKTLPPSGLSYTYWVLKFSENGDFISRFNIGSDVSSAVGITYSPSAPNEVLVLLTKSNGSVVIRSYPVSSTEMEASRVVASGETNNLSSNDVNNTGTTWANAKGFDFDPLHNRFLVVFHVPNEGVKILSLDADINLNSTADGTPAQRAAVVSSVYQTIASTPVFLGKNGSDVIRGIAFDPVNNQVYLSNNSTYYRIVPNVRLNKVRQQ